VLIGNSTHMKMGFENGAVGIVPSGAHIVPEMYQGMYDAAMKNDMATVERLQKESDAAVQRYLKGNSLGQGLAVLKAMLEKKGLCGRTMLPPLLDYKGEV
jgi:dihydrodipicolinate synthase/N-acetylneuraminate lyase